jgi:hypothetical protein
VHHVEADFGVEEAALDNDCDEVASTAMTVR